MFALGTGAQQTTTTSPDTHAAPPHPLNNI